VSSGGSIDASVNSSRCSLRCSESEPQPRTHNTRRGASGWTRLQVSARTGSFPNLEAFHPRVEYVERRLEIAHTIEDRLGAMDKLEFEEILRGIFEEDEKTAHWASAGVIGGNHPHAAGRDRARPA